MVFKWPNKYLLWLIPFFSLVDAIEMASTKKSTTLQSPIACACKSLGYIIPGDDACTLVRNPNAPCNLIAATFWMGLATSAQATVIPDVAMKNTNKVEVQQILTRKDEALVKSQTVNFRSEVNNAANSFALSAVIEKRPNNDDASSSLYTEAGKWSFLAYVTFSFAAGFKELLSRLKQWKDKMEES